MKVPVWDFFVLRRKLLTMKSRSIVFTLSLVFGLLASYFVLNRFFDIILIGDSGGVIMSFIASTYPILFVFVLSMLSRKKPKLGFWLLILFVGYTMVSHTIEYKSITWPAYTLKDYPTFEKVPFFDLAFALELITGFSFLTLMLIQRRSLTPNTH